MVPGPATTQERVRMPNLGPTQIYRNNICILTRALHALNVHYHVRSTSLDYRLLLVHSEVPMVHGIVRGKGARY